MSSPRSCCCSVSMTRFVSTACDAWLRFTFHTFSPGTKTPRGRLGRLTRRWPRLIQKWGDQRRTQPASECSRVQGSTVVCDCTRGRAASGALPAHHGHPARGRRLLSREHSDAGCARRCSPRSHAVLPHAVRGPRTPTHSMTGALECKIIIQPSKVDLARRKLRSPQPQPPPMCPARRNRRARHAAAPLVATAATAAPIANCSANTGK